ncbi:MAG: pyruvate/2-oxoglutarate dehydrogenase complex dihydrolipoamide acyltransferase (E2) component [Myxococcota bacterium]|jgi:pyruvate/2-oxoglutarate dehydrogenase complex dihydrolipoamide acyltransferase (E2) component
MPHLALVKKQNLSSFRRIAIGTWRTTYDPSVYGSLLLRMDAAMDYRDRFRAATGRRLTVSHMMARAIAGCLAEMPDANAILRFNRIYLRQRISVFFQVALKDEQTGELDLSGATIPDADQKTLLQICDEFQERVSKVRSGKDKELESSRSNFRRVPFFLLNRVTGLLSFLLYTLNLDMTWAGLPRDPFGSVMITNVGSLGLEEAYVPLVPYSRVPLLLAVGAIQKTPMVTDDDEIEIVKTMKLFATFDHRLFDGSHAAKMSRMLKAWFEDPETHFGPIPQDEQ